MRILGIVALGAALGGCASTAGTEPPSNYREIILRNKSTLFKDPDSVRDVSMTAAVPSTFGYSTCMKANARNGFGGYTGQKIYAITIFKGDSPPSLQLATLFDGCGTGNFEPFPEMEGNYVAPAATAPSGPVPTKPARPSGT